MAMSSYLINTNYVDPKFPPCEEYSQSDYLPSHSPDYYGSQRQEPAAFRSDSLYHNEHHQVHHQRRVEPPYTPCQRAPQPVSVVTSPRGHTVLTTGLHTTPVSEQSHRCDSVTPSPPPPPPCGQTPRSQSASSPASSRTDPVVYPWMKKVHVNIGKSCMGTLSLSLSLAAAETCRCRLLGVHRLSPCSVSSREEELQG